MCKVSKSVIYEFIFVLLQDALTDGSCELVCSDLSSQLTVDIKQLGVVSTVRSGACHLELNCFIFVFTQFLITIQRMVKNASFLLPLFTVKYSCNICAYSSNF